MSVRFTAKTDILDMYYRKNDVTCFSRDIINRKVKPNKCCIPKGRLSGVWYLWGGRKAPADDIVCAELTPMKKETEVTAEQLQRADELLARDELDTKDPNDLIDEIAEEANPIEHTGKATTYSQLQRIPCSC